MANSSCQQDLETAGGEGLIGASDGSTILLNQLTFEQIRPLNRESERLIAENGGLYRYSKVMGVIAREALLYALGGPVLGRALSGTGRALGWGGRLFGMSESAISKTNFITRNAFNIAGLPTMTAMGGYAAYKNGREAIEAFGNDDFATGIEKTGHGWLGHNRVGAGIEANRLERPKCVARSEGMEGSMEKSCFAAGTPLLTVGGSKSIEQSSSATRCYHGTSSIRMARCSRKSSRKYLSVSQRFCMCKLAAKSSGRRPVGSLNELRVCESCMT